MLSCVVLLYQIAILFFMNISLFSTVDLSTNSWNFVDRHTFATLQLRRHKPVLNDRRYRDVVLGGTLRLTFSHWTVLLVQYPSSSFYRVPFLEFFC